MSDMITTVLTSALVASIIGPITNEVLLWQRNKKSERLDALKAAVVLEGYSMTCASKVSDHEAFMNTRIIGSFVTNVPDLPEIRIVESFLSKKKVHIANRLVCFLQEVEQAKQEISFLWETYHDLDDVKGDALRLCACVGLHALGLAICLRQGFGLPTRVLTFSEISVQEVLEKHVSNCAQ